MSKPLRDHADGVVSPEFTDEALLAETYYMGRTAELLLMAPPEQRQNVVVERQRRIPALSLGYDPFQTLQEILVEQGWYRL